MLRLKFSLREKAWFEYLHIQWTNDQSVENITQKPQIDKTFKNLFEDELNCLDGDALVSYIPPKDMINPSFEEMYE